MSGTRNRCARPSRLSLPAGGLAAAAGAGLTGGTATAARGRQRHSNADVRNSRQAEPFWGQHQGGIVTPPQSHTYFAAFDLVTTKRDDVVNCCRWTSAAARMAAGQTAEPLDERKRAVALLTAPTSSASTGRRSPSAIPARLSACRRRG